MLENVGLFVLAGTECSVICTWCYRMLGNFYLVLQNVSNLYFVLHNLCNL